MKKGIWTKVFVLGVIVICIGIGAYLTYKTYNLNKHTIETNASFIFPYRHTSSPLTIYAAGSSDISNVTLYYKYIKNEYTNELIFTNYFKSKNINYPNVIVIVDGIAMIPSLKNHSITLIDATNPSNLRELSHVTDRTYLCGAHDVDMTMDKNYAYVISYSGKTKFLTMWNITNKTSPSRVNTISLGNETGMYLDLDDDENFLYATTKTYIYIFNVTNKATYQMSQVVKFYTGREGYFWHPTIYGDTLYVADADFFSPYGGYGINVYNVSNKSSPHLIANLSTNKTVCDMKIATINGFKYLIHIGIVGLKGSITGNITCFNITTNPKNPSFMFDYEWYDSGNNYTNVHGFDTKNGYLYVQKGNNFNQWNNGMVVFNWTDTSSMPVYVTKIYGIGSPYYLNDVHGIAFDYNGSAATVYGVTMIDDSMVMLSTGFKESISGGCWMRYDVDSSFPWSWNFPFPNGTGCYQFYTLGRKIGYPDEIAPLAYDTSCFFEKKD